MLISVGAAPGPLRRAAAWAFAAAWVRQAVTIGGSLAIAAIIGPEQFGLVALALVYVAFIELFLEQGLGSAVVQRKDLTSAHLASAFWLTLGVGALLTAASVSLAHLGASVLGYAELAPMIVVLSFTLPLGSLAVVQQSLLQRRLQYKQLGLRTSVASLAGAGTGIAAAVAGWEGWALIAQYVCGSVVSTALLWGLSDWRPRGRPSVAAVRDLAGFSLGVFSSRIATFVNRRAEVVLVGMYLGPSTVGTLRLADRLMNSALDALVRPLQGPVFAHLSRLQGEQRRRVLVARVVRTTCSVTIPVMAVIAGGAGTLPWVLGAEWSPSVGPLRILCLVGAMQAVTLCTGPVVNATGRSLSLSGVLWVLAVLRCAALVVALPRVAGRPVVEQAVLLSAVQAGVFAVFYVPANAALMVRSGAVDPLGVLLAPVRGCGVGLGVLLAGLSVESLFSRSTIDRGLLHAAATLGACAAAAVLGIAVAEPSLRAMVLDRLRPALWAHRVKRAAPN